MTTKHAHHTTNHTSSLVPVGFLSQPPGDRKYTHIQLCIVKAQVFTNADSRDEQTPTQVLFITLHEYRDIHKADFFINRSLRHIVHVNFEVEGFYTYILTYILMYKIL